LLIERQDYHAGLICAVLANIHRDPKRSNAFKPEDFMPGKTESKQQTPEQMMQIIKLYQKYFEAKDE